MGANKNSNIDQQSRKIEPKTNKNASKMRVYVIGVCMGPKSGNPILFIPVPNKG